MVRIQIMLKKYNYGQPKTIYPTNFKIDFKNEKLELRAVSLDDAKILCNSLSDDGKEKTKIIEKSSYGDGIDIIMPLEMIESILTFKH